MCKICNGYQSRLDTLRSELMNTPIGNTDKLNRLGNEIDGLEVDYLLHRNICHLWEDFEELQPDLIFAENN